jgi:hypothetical protein
MMYAILVTSVLISCRMAPRHISKLVEKHPAGALYPPATTPSRMSSIWETSIDLVESPAKGQQHPSPSTENEVAVRERSGTPLRNCTESKMDLREHELECRAAVATRA